MNKTNIIKGIITVCFIISALSVGAKAQSIWYQRAKGNSISLEINKPVIPSDSVGTIVFPGLSTFSGSVFLSGRYSLTKNITLVADIPISHGKIDNDTLFTDGDQTMLGNPYIGAEFYLKDKPFFFELGMRIPLAPDDKVTAVRTGLLSDFDRAEAFFNNIIPFYGSINFESLSDSKLYLKARGGLNLWFNTDSLTFDNDPFVVVDYTLQAGYIDKAFEFLFTADGRYDLSSGPKLPQKDNVLVYGVSVTVPYKKFRPGISFRVPGNELSGNLINYVIGLNFEYSL